MLLSPADAVPEYGCVTLISPISIAIGVNSSTTASNPGLGIPVVLLSDTVNAPSAEVECIVTGSLSTVASSCESSVSVPLNTLSTSFFRVEQIE